jgi:hypothetical protein
MNTRGTANLGLKEQIPQLEKQKRPVAFTCPTKAVLLGFLIRVDGSLADVNGWQVLRDFKHVNPGGDEEAQELQNNNVNFLHPSFSGILQIPLYFRRAICIA